MTAELPKQESILSKIRQALTFEDPDRKSRGRLVHVFEEVKQAGTGSKASVTLDIGKTFTVINDGYGVSVKEE